MWVYKTCNGEYPITGDSGVSVIKARQGIHKGEDYEIIGYIGPDTPVSVEGRNQSFRLFLKLDGLKREVDYRDIEHWLDEIPEEGKRIVARLRGIEERFAPDFTDEDLFVTSPIEGIFWKS